MEAKNVLEVEKKLKKGIDISMSVNDLRLMVGCFNALEYMAETYGEEFMFLDESRELRDRLEGLYGDEIEGAKISGREASRIGA